MRNRLLLASAIVLGASTHALAQAVPQQVETSAGTLAVEVVADGLVHPWGLAFLPDGRMLVTERPGDLRIVGEDGGLSEPLGGVPEVFVEGQGGLLGIAVDPDFENNRLVYLSFAEAREGGAATSAGRGRLADDESALEDFEVIFRQEPAVAGDAHFGSRLVFSGDGHLFVTLGERFDQMQQAQDPTNHIGTLVRIAADGSVPDDNPFVGQEGADEIWSFGHRNVQGAALHPETGALWIVEHGPQGGDELNIPEAGQNYGWPEVSWGEHYWNEPIPDHDNADFAEPIHHWTPAIAPSGLAFVTGDMFPDWQGDALVGGLVAEGIVRLALDGDAVADEERIPLGARVRDVVEGPDGALYVLTDHEAAHLLRLSAGG